MATIQEAAQNAAAQSSSEILAFNAQINLLKDQLSTSSEDVTTKVTKIAESTARVEALEAELKLTTDQVGLGREGREEDERGRGTASQTRLRTYHSKPLNSSRKSKPTSKKSRARSLTPKTT